MKERTTADAFRDLVTGKYDETRGIQWSITSLSPKKTLMSNGMQYCFAEVTFKNGIQYGIEAFGEEAEDLFDEVSVHSAHQHQEPMLITA